MANSNLDKIEKIMDELEKRSGELKELNVITENLESLSKTVTDSNTIIKLEAKKLNEFIVDSSEKINKVERSIEKIDNVNFPNRLDKLDIAVTSINQGLQNTQLKLENLGRDLKDEVTAIKTDFSLKFEANKKEIKVIKILVLATMILCIGIIVLEIIKW